MYTFGQAPLHPEAPHLPLNQENMLLWSTVVSDLENKINTYNSCKAIMQNIHANIALKIKLIKESQNLYIRLYVYVFCRMIDIPMNQMKYIQDAYW